MLGLKNWQSSFIAMVEEIHAFAIDRVNPEGAVALQNLGISLFNGEDGS